MATMTTVKRGSYTITEGQVKADGRLAFDVVITEGAEGTLEAIMMEYSKKGMKKVSKRAKKLLRKGDTFVVRIISVFWGGETMSSHLECVR